MALITLAIPPGILRTGTDYRSKGRWLDANLWRWFSGEQRPVGGWAQRSQSADGGVGGGAPEAISGKARAMLTWKDNTNRPWCGIGTHTDLYAMTPGGYTYNITPTGFTEGEESASAGGSYGSGLYGGGLYGFGEPTDAITKEASVWSLDTWGENLVGVMAEDGIIYEWVPDVADEAVAITGAPTARAIVTTSERILMALGADDNPRLVQWSDAEDNTDWSPSDTNLSRSQELQTVGRLQCGRRVAGGTLLLTDVDAWFATFQGPPYVYTFAKAGEQCGLVAMGAIVATDVQAFWMSHNGFWRFNGYSNPIDCEVHDYVFSDINTTQISKVSAVHVSAFGEIWWFYPSAASNENDRYVVFNYRENHWSIGTLARLCGADKGAFAYLMMTDASGVVWDHERDYDHGGTQPFVESGPVEIGEGGKTVLVSRVIPDEKTLGDVNITFTTAFWPKGDEADYGPYTLTEETFTRFSARQAKVKLTGDDETDFRVGNFRLDVVMLGER